MRITISLTKDQLSLMDKMMVDDLQTNRSAFIVFLLSQENKARNKVKPGRPRKTEDDDSQDTGMDDDYSDDLPKDQMYFGTMIGAREYADKEHFRQQFQPRS